MLEGAAEEAERASGSTFGTAAEVGASGVPVEREASPPEEHPVTAAASMTGMAVVLQPARRDLDGAHVLSFVWVSAGTLGVRPFIGRRKLRKDVAVDARAERPRATNQIVLSLSKLLVQLAGRRFIGVVGDGLGLRL